MEAQERILEKLMNVCEDIISQAFVVSDGYRVSAVVLDKKIAEFLCKEMRKKYNSDAWGIFTIPQSVEYAFSRGVRYGRDVKAEQPVDVPAQGDVDGKDQELRESGLQPEQESN